MITVKNKEQIEMMRIAGSIVAETLELVEKHVKPGISTRTLDKIAHEYIISRGAKPSFLHYQGFPATICASASGFLISEMLIEITFPGQSLETVFLITSIFISLKYDFSPI